jgi:hypothetical protein
MKYLLALLLLLSAPAFAQSNLKAPAATIVPAKVAFGAATQMSELDYYKQLSKQAADSVSSANTLSWSVFGLLVTVMLAILAFQFLFNIRLNKADISSIEDRMRAEIARAQAVQSGVLNELDAANRLAFETRIRAIETQLRIDINRELDTTKATLNSFLAVQERAIKLIEAEMQAGVSSASSSDYMLPTYLALAEEFAPGEQIDVRILSRVSYYLKNVKSLKREDYERVLKIMPQLEARIPPFGSLVEDFRKIVDAISLYDMVPGEIPGSFNAQYYKNKPSWYTDPVSE